MASENETVAEVASDMRGITFGEEQCPECGADFQRTNRWKDYADRFESAHQREVAELRECLQLAVEMKCANCGLCTRDTEPCHPDGQIVHHEDCWMIMKWRKALEGAKDEN